MNNSFKKTTVAIHDLFPLFIILLGVVTFFFIPIIHPLTLKVISSDHELGETIIKNSLACRENLGISGILLILCGWLCRKFSLFKFIPEHFKKVDLALGILSVFWIVLIMEICLRVSPVPSDSEVLKRSLAYEPSAFARHKFAPFKQEILDASGAIRAVIQNGYRGRAFPAEKPKGEKRIVFLGGSFVFDSTGMQNLDWPHRIENILNAVGYSNFRVINAGVPGHTTSDSIGRLYSEIHFYQPDYVVLCNAWNDIKYFNYVSPENTLLKKISGLTVPTHRKAKGYQKLLEQSQIYLRFHTLVQKLTSGYAGAEGKLPKGQLLDSFDKWGLQQYRLNVEIFVDICRNIGAEPILFTQPRLVDRTNSKEDQKRIKYEYVLLSHEALNRAFDACDFVISDVARRKRVKVFDLAPLFTGRSKFFQDHVHLSEFGSEKVAEAVADFFLLNELTPS